MPGAADLTPSDNVLDGGSGNDSGIPVLNGDAAAFGPEWPQEAGPGSVVNCW